MLRTAVSTKKRRHISKKGKTSWRKNVDIKDVEDFLEDQRLEERLGTRFSEKPDDELFVIDTKADDVKDECQLTDKQRKRLAIPETPKCFQALVNPSKVPIPCGPHTGPKPKEISDVTKKKKMLRGVYKKKLDMAKSNRELDRQRKLLKKDLNSNINKDLWNDDSLTKLAQPQQEWLSKDTRDVNKPLIIPKRPAKKAPSKSKPIVLPHPGLSYNPTYKDHQEIMQSVVHEELKVIKDESHLNRVTSGMFRKITAAQKMKEDLEELQQGLKDTGNVEEDDGEYRAVNPPVVNKKKSRKVKTHVRQERLIKNKKKVELAERKKIGEIYKLRFIQKSIVKKEDCDSKVRELRKKKALETPHLPRINKTPFVEPAPLLLDSKDLSGNLRGLVPKGGGLVDHFTSLQRRGIAPVSVPLRLKKAKKKRYTLRDHKMPWEITEGFAKPSKRNQSTLEI